jgi:hypothetical protein
MSIVPIRVEKSTNNKFIDTNDANTKKILSQALEVFYPENLNYDFKCVYDILPCFGVYASYFFDVHYRIDISSQGKIIRIVEFFELPKHVVEEYVIQKKNMYNTKMNPSRVPYVLNIREKMYTITLSGSVFDGKRDMILHNPDLQADWLFDMWEVSSTYWILCIGKCYMQPTSNPTSVDEIQFVEIDIEKNKYNPLSPTIKVSYHVSGVNLEFLGAWIDVEERKGYVAVFHHPLTMLPDTYGHATYLSDEIPIFIQECKVPPPLDKRLNIQTINLQESFFP